MSKQITGLITWLKNWFYDENEVNDLLDDKQDTLISGTNIKTVNNNSLLGSGNINIQGGSSVDIDTSFPTNPTDTHVPSTKLVKNSLNGKANSTHSHNISDVSNLQSNLNNKVDEDDLLDLIYPVGAIYIDANSSNSVCPIQTLLGGTWERIQDRFLLASTNQQGVGTTGGEEKVTLTANQSGLRAHGHGMAHNHNHRHTMAGKWSSGSGSKTAYMTTNNRSQTDTYTSYDSTGSSKNTTDDNTAQNATEAHNNMPPYIMVNVWKRTA